MSPARRWGRVALWPLVAGAVLAVALALAEDPARAEDMTVHAERKGGHVVVDVQARVPAPPAVVWAVLTDYEHMPEFLGAITASTVRLRNGSHWEVAQTIQTRFGFLRFSASSVRAVDLVPLREIRSTLIEGDFVDFSGTTRLVEDAGGVTIVNHTEYTPKAWLPPVVGTAVIESETRRQYEQLVAEMLRRARAP
jgi:uncharacterized membrane protein